jgi:anti-sigma B factor antagonist
MAARRLHRFATASRASRPVRREGEGVVDNDLGARPPPFRCAVVEEDRTVVVEVEGEIDIATTKQVRRTIEQLVDDGRRAVIVDMSRVAFVDSAGIADLIRASGAAGRRGVEFVVRSPSRAVRRMLEITGLDQLLVIRDEPEA